MNRFDSASMRRFNYKIKFDWLTQDGIKIFFYKYFKQLIKATELTKEEEKRLCNIRGLAPGDFKVVFQKLAIKNPDEVPAGKIIDFLELEIKHKKNLLGAPQIGFQS